MRLEAIGFIPRRTCLGERSRLIHPRLGPSIEGIDDKMSLLNLAKRSWGLG